MLSLLKVNEPLRLVLMVLFLIGCRMAIWSEMPLTVLDVKWQLLGQQMSEGKSMYIDIVDDTAPLAAGVYWLIDKFFGKSLWAYQILATILVFVQALILNRIMNRKNLYSERNFLPTFFYFLFMSAHFEFSSLSPPLICLTFLVLVISNIFSLDQKAFDESVLNTGILMGLSILVYLPSIFFLGFVVIGFAVFRTVTFRQYMLLVFGILFVLGLYAMYYAWLGGINEFLKYFASSIFKIHFISDIKLTTLLAMLAIPSFWLFLAVFKTFSYLRFINYQNSCRFLMFLWLIFATFSLGFNYRFSGVHLLVFAPVFVYFLLYLVLLIKRTLVRELVFLLLIGSILSVSYLSFYQNPYLKDYFDFSTLLVKKDNRIQNKRILVLGNSLHLYHQNRLASPYFNWELAKSEFNRLEYYPTAIRIYEQFEKDKPEVIIDEQNIVGRLFARLPILKKYYEHDTAQKSIYWLKKEFLEKNAK